MTQGTLRYDHKGIGQVLKQEPMKVPVNQRSYAWEENHVRDLLQDFANAIASENREYFLGTIVLTQSDGERPEIADGQQRLATVSMLIAAVRDYLLRENKDDVRAHAIEHDYLKTTDLRTEEPIVRLTLNVEDHEFFTKYILSHPDSGERNTSPTKPSHRKIVVAAGHFPLSERHTKTLAMC